MGEMTHLISGAIAKINSLLKQLQVKQFLAFTLAAFLLLTTNTIVPGNQNQALSHKDGSERPKTTGEFLEEARGDVPLGERINNITRDSAEAFKDFGSIYTEGAKRAASDIKENLADTGKNISENVQR
jgi:hypothetical protein